MQIISDPQLTPGYVAGNRTVHALRPTGFYASGARRYAKLCGYGSRDRHDPSPVATGTEITCGRCLAALAKREARLTKVAPLSPSESPEEAEG